MWFPTGSRFHTAARWQPPLTLLLCRGLCPPRPAESRRPNSRLRLWEDCVFLPRCRAACKTAPQASAWLARLISTGFTNCQAAHLTSCKPYCMFPVALCASDVTSASGTQALPRGFPSWLGWVLRALLLVGPQISAPVSDSFRPHSGLLVTSDTVRKLEDLVRCRMPRLQDPACIPKQTMPGP